MTNNQKILMIMDTLQNPVDPAALPAELAALVTPLIAVINAWEGLAHPDHLAHAQRIVVISELRNNQDPNVPVIAWADALATAGGA